MKLRYVFSGFLMTLALWSGLEYGLQYAVQPQFMDRIALVMSSSLTVPTGSKTDLFPVGTKSDLN